MLFPTDNLIWVMPTEGLSVYGVTRMRFFILKGTNIMNITPRQMLLYAVSDRAWSRDDEEFIAQVRQAVMSGVTIFQLREKQADYEQFKKIALKIKPICKEYGVPLIINDNVKVWYQERYAIAKLIAPSIFKKYEEGNISAIKEYLKSTQEGNLKNALLAIGIENNKDGIEILFKNLQEEEMLSREQKEKMEK